MTAVEHKRNGWQRVLSGNIGVMTITQAMGMFARFMVFPYASLFVLSLGGQARQVGWINSLTPLMGLLMFPLGGYLADHAGRVRLIVITGALSGLVYLCHITATSWHWIAVGGVLLGMGCVRFPASSALIADSLAPAERGKGIATMNTVAGAVAIVAPYVAGALIERLGVDLGMRLLYGWILISYVAIALIQLRWLKETGDATRSFQRQDLRGVLREVYGDIPDLWRRISPDQKRLGAAMLLGFVSNALVGPFWVVYAVERIGLSTSAWGLILLIEALTRIVGYVPAGELVDRWGRRRPLLLSLGISTLAMPLFLLVSGFWGALAVRMTHALAHALLVPSASALMADLTPRESRGRVMAALGRGTVLIGASAGGTGGPGLGFMITLPLMAASFSAGYVYELSESLPWLIVTALVALAFGVILMGVREPEVAEQ